MEYAIASETIAPGSRAALNVRLQSALKHQQVAGTVDGLFPIAKRVKGCGVQIFAVGCRDAGECETQSCGSTIVWLGSSGGSS